MSEFELIETAPPEPGATVSYSRSNLIGESAQAVLSLSINPENEQHPWPTLSDIPGLRALQDGSNESPFAVHQDGRITRISWNGHELLESRDAPHLYSVELDGLPGLKARPGDRLPVPFQQALRWDWRLHDGQRFYGTGQRSTPLDRRGTAPVNWTTDEPTGHSRSTDPLYQAHPLLWGVTGEIWWAALFLHSPYTRFDLGQDQHDRMRWISLGASAELQLHAAPSPAQLHASLSQVWETPSAPPLWSLGFHQSRWGYRSADEVQELVDTFSAKEIPLDVVHLDIDHMEDYRSFSFSKERFPNPKELFAKWAQKGVRAVTIIDPGLRFDPGNGYQPLDRGLAGGHFLKSPSGAPVVGYCWPDEALFPDFSRQAARQWWAEEAAFYLNTGISGLWIDMNEPAIFDKPFWSGGVQQQPMPLDTPGGEGVRPYNQGALHNLYGSYMAQATQAAWDETPKRPWVLTRSGFTGVAAHAWSWMGDNTSWWEHLQLSLPQLASMGLVGSSFVGVDIGGFFGHCTPELYSAWIETSVIYPLMRAHSALGTRQQHPWSFGPEVEEVARTAIDLRYRLLPYFYTVAIAQAQGALPWLRPMVFDYPNDQRFHALEDQVMVGPSLMAAPFLWRGRDQRLVQLPEGAWYDLHSGERHQGPSSMIIDRRPGLTPLFAKAGSIIPTLENDHGVHCTDQLPGKTWVLHACPGVDGVVTDLYWDRGEGWDFINGESAHAGLSLEGETLKVISSESGDNLTLPHLRLATPSEPGWKIGSARSWNEVVSHQSTDRTP